MVNALWTHDEHWSILEVHHARGYGVYGQHKELLVENIEKGFHISILLAICPYSIY